VITTRSQAVDEKLAVIMAMLESQQGKQEELLARTSELSEQQQKSQGQLAELQRLRQYVEGMGKSLEARMEAAEKEPATAVKVKPRPSEDSHTTVGLRTSAPEFRPSDGITDGDAESPPCTHAGSREEPGSTTAASPTL
jgi:hypothetical protein